MLTELRAYLMLSDSSLIFFKFDLHKVDIEKRKRLFQLPNHPNPLVPIGIRFNAAYIYYQEQPATIMFDKFRTGRGWGMAVPG